MLQVRITIPYLISIHAPLRGRHECRRKAHGRRHFNPRPLAGATPEHYATWAGFIFQSTPPCGGDFVEKIQEQAKAISIHAPLRGRLKTNRKLSGERHFNPRPLAGATEGSRFYDPDPPISIHAPLRGRRIDGWYHQWSDYFNPRPLAGATLDDVDPLEIKEISIHAPLRGRHRICPWGELGGEISIHAPLRGRRFLPPENKCCPQFQSTPPCGGDELGGEERQMG